VFGDGCFANGELKKRSISMLSVRKCLEKKPLVMNCVL